MLGFEPVSVLPRVPEVPDPPMRERPLEIVLNAPAADAQRRPSAAQAVELADGATSGIDQLGRAAAAGDVAALGHLYDELLAPIYRYIAVRVHRREDAEDLTQVVFERIVAGLPRYRSGRSPFAAWVFRIARNAVIDHVRRERPTEQLDPVHEVPHGEEVEAISLRGEQIRELRRAIANLTPDQQEAIVLRFVAGLSAEEAAQVMGRRAGTIRGLTFRAIGALRRHLNEDAE
ncbi:MAG: sigma-70 family RNA polymerase sigma factor [Chloroflexi bacterium]|nr:MAG: sigma-70 family RNA polymerase sigma factor [Chloroflexota bacterium]